MKPQNLAVVIILALFIMLFAITQQNEVVEVDDNFDYDVTMTTVSENEGYVKHFVQIDNMIVLLTSEGLVNYNPESGQIYKKRIQK